jgi:hypothetical protein
MGELFDPGTATPGDEMAVAKVHADEALARRAEEAAVGPERPFHRDGDEMAVARAWTLGEPAGPLDAAEFSEMLTEQARQDEAVEDLSDDDEGEEVFEAEDGSLVYADGTPADEGGDGEPDDLDGLFSEAALDLTGGDEEAAGQLAEAARDAFEGLVDEHGVEQVEAWAAEEGDDKVLAWALNEGAALLLAEEG